MSKSTFQKSEECRGAQEVSEKLKEGKIGFHRHGFVRFKSRGQRCLWPMRKYKEHKHTREFRPLRSTGSIEVLRARLARRAPRPGQLLFVDSDVNRNHLVDCTVCRTPMLPRGTLSLDASMRINQTLRARNLAPRVGLSRATRLIITQSLLAQV